MPQSNNTTALDEARRKFRQHEAHARELQQTYRRFEEAVCAFDEAIEEARKGGRRISPYRLARVYRFKAECLDKLNDRPSAYSTLCDALAMLSEVPLSKDLISLISDIDDFGSQSSAAAALSRKIDDMATKSEGRFSRELKSWFEVSRETQRLRINAADMATKRASVAFESRTNAIAGYKLLLPHEERSLRESAASTARLLQFFETALSKSRCLSSQCEKWRRDGAFDECRLLACQALFVELFAITCLACVAFVHILRRCQIPVSCKDTHFFSFRMLTLPANRYGLGAIHNELGDAFRAIRAVKRSKRDACRFAALACSRYRMKLRRHYVRCCLELGCVALMPTH